MRNKKEPLNYISICPRTIPFPLIKNACYEVCVKLFIPDKGEGSAICSYVGYLPYGMSKDDASLVADKLAEEIRRLRIKMEKGERGIIVEEKHEQ